MAAGVDARNNGYSRQIFSRTHDIFLKMNGNIFIHSPK